LAGVTAVVCKVKNAINAEVTVAGRHSLHFNLVRHKRRCRFLVDLKAHNLRADVGGELEIIPTGGKAAAEIVGIHGWLLRTAHGALAAVLRDGHAGGQQERGC